MEKCLSKDIKYLIAKTCTFLVAKKMYIVIYQIQ